MRKRQPAATLGELMSGKGPHWFWMTCNRCAHYTATTLAWAVIRYGPNASSDILRKNARCSHCGARGAHLTRPSWVDIQIGFAPFPVDRLRDQDRPAHLNAPHRD